MQYTPHRCAKEATVCREDALVLLRREAACSLLGKEGAGGGRVGWVTLVQVLRAQRERRLPIWKRFDRSRAPGTASGQGPWTLPDPSNVPPSLADHIGNTSHKLCVLVCFLAIPPWESVHRALLPPSADTGRSGPRGTRTTQLARTGTGASWRCPAKAGGLP